MTDTSKKTDKLYDLLHTLGKKRSIELMSLVRKLPRSYTELQKELGINSKLVSTKIKELLDLHILKKEGDKYDLSKLGKKILKKIKPLTKVVLDFTEDMAKTSTKKVVAKKPAAKKVTAKAVVKKSPVVKKKVAPKKAAVKAKAPAKKKVVAKKPAAKKVTAKAVVKKSPVVKKKVAPKKAAVKAKAPAKKKVVAKKPAAKKVTAKATPKKK